MTELWLRFLSFFAFSQNLKRLILRAVSSILLVFDITNILVKFNLCCVQYSQTYSHFVLDTRNSYWVHKLIRRGQKDNRKVL